MNEIIYIDRLDHQRKVEKVYGRAFIEIMYGSGLLSSIASMLLSSCVCRLPWISRLYGLLQSSKLSQRKVAPFIKEFQIDTSEFLHPPSSFKSFNEFFVRKLHKAARKIESDERVAIMPADARYLVYPDISTADGFLVKGEKFSLEELLQDSQLAALYKNGSMVIARLCPTDYHRFHFPCDCRSEPPFLLNGFLSSVNPLALKKNIRIFSQNKRCLSVLHSDVFGQILYLEVGATCVGSIHHTSRASFHCKGEEKGFFSFGGSSLILLFQPQRIAFDADLVEASNHKIEVKGLMGQSLGRAIASL